jgi:cytochrome c553
MGTSVNTFLRFLPTLALVILQPVTSHGQGSVITQPLSSIERHALNPPREMLDLGKSVATNNCAGCHRIDGDETAPGIPSLAGQRTVYMYRVLQSYRDRIRHHDAMNHAVGFLNEDALLAVAAFYGSLTPFRPQADSTGVDQSADPGAGDPFVSIRNDMKKCNRCHGDDGNASASGMPNLTAQSTEYFVASMKAYAEGGRDHRLMGRLANDLDEAKLTRMGVFYAVQEPARTQITGDGNAELGRAAAEPCAICHGEDGNADNAEMPTLAGQDARYFLKAMKAYKEGKRKHEDMFAAVDSLDEKTITDMAAFYAMQTPIRRNVKTPLTTAEWIDRCARCHGIDGNSSDPRFPMLAGQDRAYLAATLNAYASGGRASSTMHAMAGPLSDADIERIAAYYSGREPKSVIYMQLPCEEPTTN